MGRNPLSARRNYLSRGAPREILHPADAGSRGCFDSVSVSLRKSDNCAEDDIAWEGSAHDDVDEFAWHYNHFHNLLAGNGCLDFFGRQGALADYAL
jgi:hypothetical protein